MNNIENLKDGYAFIVKTNEYSGNFEREMCAHMTGVTGECEVGSEYVPKDDLGFSRIIMSCPDEYGCYRPVESCGPEYNDVAIFFDERPTDEQIEVLKERAKSFNEAWKTEGTFNYTQTIEILGFSLIKVNRTEEEIEL